MQEHQKPEEGNKERKNHFGGSIIFSRRVAYSAISGGQFEDGIMLQGRSHMDLKAAIVLKDRDGFGPPIPLSLSSAGE